MEPCKPQAQAPIIVTLYITVSGRRARQQLAKNNLCRQLHCVPPLAVRHGSPSSSSRGLATDAVSAENLYAFGAKHVTKGLGRITEGIMTKGEGSYVVYDDGRRVLDFTCGIGVTNLGKLYLLLGDGLMPATWGWGFCGLYNSRPFLDEPIYTQAAMLTVRTLERPLFLDVPPYSSSPLHVMEISSSRASLWRQDAEVWISADHTFRTRSS